MKTTLVVLVALALLALSVDAQRNRQRGRGRGRNRQNCHLKAVDECLKKLEDMGKKADASDIITTPAGLDNLCETIQGSITCIKGYMKKCATPIQRELLDFGIEQFVNSLDKFCAQGPDRDAFLKHSPCINAKILKQKEYHEGCVRDIFAMVDKATGIFNKTLEDPNLFNFEKTSAKGLSDQILDLACCGINRFQTCSQKIITRECGDDAVKAMKTFVTRTLGGSAERICPRSLFEETKKECTDVLPVPGTIPKGKLSDNPVGKYALNYLNIIFNYEEP
jgi:hypothetical protein